MGPLLRVALEALARYKLRTALSVLGVVFGVAAVIAMMSVSQGAAREALTQVDALGLDNLVARSRGSSAYPGAWRGLTASDAGRLSQLVPGVRHVSPLIHRTARVAHDGTSRPAVVLGVRAAFAPILRLTVDRGRFLTVADERDVARRAVIGASLARELFRFRSAVGEHVTVGGVHYEVIGVLAARGGSTKATRTLAWHDVDRALLVPLPSLSGHTLGIATDQPVDEIWLQVEDGERANELGVILQRVLNRSHSPTDFTIVVPRELLAQRYRTQRTFSIVVGSVAVLALLVGGIGIMNIMLTSVVERTREIGVRRTAGAKKRDVTMQFLIETLLMTVGGGVAGIVIGAIVSMAISAYAGWSTYVSITAVLLGFVVSFLVGLVFGLYTAMKAAQLQPVDAMRYE